MKKKTEFMLDLKLSHIRIKRVEINHERGEFHIYASCMAHSTICHKCNGQITKSHGLCHETKIEHLPIFDNRVFIHIRWPRFMCDKCGDQATTSFHPEWLSLNGECTKDYENYILKCLINSTAKDVADKNRTTEERVEGIVNRCISLDIKWEGMPITRMGIDEIALKKGHNHYLTIVSDISVPGRVRILQIISGRTQVEILPFFESIPESIWRNLESVSTDMGGSYISTLKKVLGEELFDKIVTIDRFHVAKLINGKVDKERKRVSRELNKEFKKDESTEDKIKGTMWPFRHHPEDLDEEKLQRLNTLLQESPYLKKCHELRENLYSIFESNLEIKSAKVMIDSWCLMALELKTTNNPFESFVKTYYQHEVNILNYFLRRHTSGPVEGLNNKIKVIKRRGFGFDNVINFAKRLFLDINLKEIYIPNLAGSVN